MAASTSQTKLDVPLGYVRPRGHWLWRVEAEEVELDPMARLLLGVPPGTELPLPLREVGCLLEVDDGGVPLRMERQAIIDGLASGLGCRLTASGRSVRFEGRRIAGSPESPQLIGGTVTELEPEPVRTDADAVPRLARLELLRQLAEAGAAQQCCAAVEALAVQGLARLFPGCRILVSRIDAGGCMRIEREHLPPGLPPLQGEVVDLRVAPDYLRRLRGPGWLVEGDVASAPLLAPLAPALLALGIHAVVDAIFDDAEGVRWLICVDAPASRIWPESELETVRAVAGQLRLMRETERALHGRAEAREMLERAQRQDALGRLAGGVAHDFHNMLQAVAINHHLARAELVARMEAGGLEARQSLFATVEHLDHAQEAILRASRLVQRLLSFGRGRGPGLRRPVRLDRLLLDIEELARRGLPAERELVLTVEEGLEVLGNATALEQAVINLVVNAGQATEAGGCVVLCLEARGPEGAPQAARGGSAGWACISVSDDGCGIPEESLHRIFEPFYSTRAPGLGTGLGLAMVKATAERHGGSVRVQSTVGVGTCIELWLPRG